MAKAPEEVVEENRERRTPKRRQRRKKLKAALERLQAAVSRLRTKRSIGQGGKKAISLSSGALKLRHLWTPGTASSVAKPPQTVANIYV